MSEPRQNTLPAILIPGFSGDACRAIASELLSKGFPVIAACEEGNAAEAIELGCAVVEAERGGGLRAGLEYFNAEMAGLPGVLIADPEDCYSPEEIMAVAYVFAVNPQEVVVGARAMPKRQKSAGARKGKKKPNGLDCKAASAAFAVVHGRAVKDAWSGLMALPAAKMPQFLGEKGDGRRLLFRALLTMQKNGLKAVNIPINAPYRRRPGETGRARLFDIGNIVWLPVKFISASLTATLCDYCIRFSSFGLLFANNQAMWTYSLIAGRTTGGIVGYFLNRSLVFRKKNDSLKKELWMMAQYMLLVVINFGLSWLLVNFFMWLTGSFYIASPLADAVLYLMNYTIQRDIIFKHKERPVKQ